VFYGKIHHASRPAGHHWASGKKTGVPYSV